MSDHFHHTAHDGPPSLPLTVVHDLLSGRLMIPATAVTLLLRTIAAGWTASPCDDTDCRRTAELYAADLTGYADQLDVECIAATGREADPAD
ncbi:hypothetical protein ACIGZJ_34585 [Kitasatospora sp. NPDC052868]|uniref:hypothetical protein n=1 Tax=Kitasatospora sp. NPDC052868 TaxID=3364060 RepID=UPI0037CC45C8